MKFRLKRVTHGSINAPPPVVGPELETVHPDPHPAWDDGPEYYVQVETLEDLADLDALAGDEGLIIHFKPTDQGWHRDSQPTIIIYDGYIE